MCGGQGEGGKIPTDSFFSKDYGLRSLDLTNSSPGLTKNCHFTGDQSCCYSSLPHEVQMAIKAEGKWAKKGSVMLLLIGFW